MLKGIRYMNFNSLFELDLSKEFRKYLAW